MIGTFGFCVGEGHIDNFTTLLGCTRKLYYATHPDLYDNTAVDDERL